MNHTAISSVSQMRSTSKGPTLRWFVARAFDGWAPKLALVDALVATLAAIIGAAIWRGLSGPKATFETIVPMLGTGLRWSVALPIAWAALSALEYDRRDGLLALAHRHGVSIRAWLFGRVYGVFVLVFLSVALPMILVSILLACLGGGVEGTLARLSLVLPSLLSGLTTAWVLGACSALLGVILRSRLLAIGALLGAAALGIWLRAMVPNPLGLYVYQWLAPMGALNDIQSALFAEPHSALRGLSGFASTTIFSILLFQVATHSIEHELES